MTLDPEAERFLASRPEALRSILLNALDAISDEPSWGHPGRYPAPPDTDHPGEIIDLAVPGHVIVYRYVASTDRIRVRLIEERRSGR
jgi:hypothetical protein